MMQIAVKSLLTNIGELARRFEEFYGSTPRIFRAPGRVNLIGEHTDYNDGFVMPAAIDFYTWVAAAPRADNMLCVRSEQFQEQVEIPLDKIDGPPRGHWTDYVRGMAGVLQSAGHKLRGANLWIDGQVPLGAGLSSSAALELSTGLALMNVAEIDLPRMELVKLSQQAEHEYAGAMCGIMDQFIAGFGHAGYALLLDCRSLEYSLLPMSEQARLVICNSMVKHDLAAGEYNTRRAECAAAVRTLQNFYPQIRALRDANVAMLEAHRDAVSTDVYRRAHHVITEDDRVTKAAVALKASNLEEFGSLMYESHRSLRDEYKVSCAELDLLVEIASKARGVYGARMTGGGFGGCTVNLVEAASVDTFRQKIVDEYESATNCKPDVFVCSPASGAEQVDLEGVR